MGYQISTFNTKYEMISKILSGQQLLESDISSSSFINEIEDKERKYLQKKKNVKAVKFSAPKKDPNNIKENPDTKSDTKTVSNLEKFEISSKKVINRTARRRKTSVYIAKSKITKSKTLDDLRGDQNLNDMKSGYGKLPNNSTSKILEGGKISKSSSKVTN